MASDYTRGVLLSDEQLREIGRVSVLFNVLESLVALIVWAMVSEKQEIGLAVTGGDRFAALVEKFKRLATVAIKDDGLRTDALTFIAHAKEANDQRVDVMHSMMFALGPDILKVRFTKTGNRHMQWGTTAELTGIGDMIQVVNGEGAALVERLQVEFPHLLTEGHPQRLS